MGKVEDLRALREARYEKRSPVKSLDKAKKALSTPVEKPASDNPCGHTNMGGRTCTRPMGHTEKSHRYK